MVRIVPRRAQASNARSAKWFEAAPALIRPAFGGPPSPASGRRSRRHVKQRLSEEELAIFDILTRPERRLRENLKWEKFILDWRLRESAKADVREAIRLEPDGPPDVYERKLWDEKIERTYQYVFEPFPDAEAQLESS